MGVCRRRRARRRPGEGVDEATKTGAPGVGWRTLFQLLLELATCLLILSFNKYYAFAILTAVVALLQPKLGHLLDLSQGIASSGGLFTAIAGRFMVGPFNTVGFFFFCAIALGLYLSMVVTVGAVSRPHAKCLAIVVVVLVVLTLIAACILFVGHSGSKPQVVT